MQGFRARVQKSGKTYYYFDTGGKPRREIPLGPDYVLAVRKWADLTSELHKGEAVSTFLELADRYEREVLPTKAKSTQATQRGDIKMLRAFFGSPSPAPLNQIKPKHIHMLLEHHKKTPTTANRLKRVFSHMFNKARAWGYTECENPATGIEGFTLDKREVYIDDKVFAAVYEAGSQSLRDAMDLAYLTGQRPSDTLRMDEDQLLDGCLVIKQGKTGARLRIKIEGKLAEVLERISKRKAGHKLHCSNLTVNQHGKPMTKQTLRKAFEKARNAAAAAHPKMAADIKAMWFYDLRAKAADDTADDRGEQAASDLLGHDSVTTTQQHYLRRGRLVSPTK
jgi:site-specific recombinase XerC